MSRRVGYTSPARMRQILEVVDYLRNSGFVIPRPGGGTQEIAPPAAVYVRNDSGEEVPAFACMQCTGTVEVGGQNYIKIDKPADATGQAGGYLFNGIAAIEIGGYGIGHDGPLCRMLTDGSTVTCGDFWQPDIDEWPIIPGGTSFQAVGADDIETDVMRGFIPGTANMALFKTPGGGIPAASGTGPYTFGTASCTPVNPDGTVGSGSVTVSNIVDQAIAASVVIKAAKVGDIWVVDVASCGT